MPKLTNKDRENANKKAEELLLQEKALFRSMQISYEVKPVIENAEVEQFYLFRQQFFKAQMPRKLLKIPSGFIHEPSGVVLDEEFNIVSRNYTTLIKDYANSRYEGRDVRPDVVIDIIEKYLYKAYSIREICRERQLDYRYVYSIIRLRRCLSSSLVFVLKRFGSIDNYFTYLFKNTDMNEM